MPYGSADPSDCVAGLHTGSWIPTWRGLAQYHQGDCITGEIGFATLRHSAVYVSEQVSASTEL